MKNIFSVLFTCCTLLAMANNATISNFTYLSGSNQLQFDVSWDNSWRNTNVTGSTQNYDGVWVFAKFRASCSKDSVIPGDYHHVWLDTTIGNHVVPAGFTGKVGTTTIGSFNRGMGVFLYRSSDGTGSVNLTGVKLKWDVASQGVIGTDWDIQLFVVEMVYVPQASFFFGDKYSNNNSFEAGGTRGAFLMQNETDVISISSGAANLGFLYDPYLGGSATFPSTFPKGIDAFWTMKYEVTQGQYSDYLNTLSRFNQQLSAPNCFSVLETGNTTVTFNQRWAFYSQTIQFGARNGVRMSGPSDTTSSVTIDPSRPVTFVCDLNPMNAGNSNDDGQTVACNFLAPTLLFKFLDWAALRPMNEFEFEKICRGPFSIPAAYQFTGLYPWGASTIQASGTGLTNPGTPTEALTTVANGSGLVVTGMTPDAPSVGPRRVGITQTAGSTRLQGGVSYYGAADMAGNVSEICIRLNSSGSSAPQYTRNSHGDGELSTAFTALSWPYTMLYGSVGIILRGGSFASNQVYDEITTRPFNNSFGYAVECLTYYGCSSGVEYGPSSTPNISAMFVEMGGRGVRQAQ